MCEFPIKNVKMSLSRRLLQIKAALLWHGMAWVAFVTLPSSPAV